MDTILTPEEEFLVSEFRGRVLDVLVKEEHKSEHFLIKWIRAREHNLEKAEEMLRKSYAWREEKGADQILSKEIDPFFTETYPFYLDGLDRDGRPVFTIPFGAWDIRKSVDMEKLEGLMEYFIYMMESANAAIHKQSLTCAEGGIPITKLIVIMDCKNYSFSQLRSVKAVQSVLTFASQFESFYPEIMFKSIVINAPKAFHMLFGIAKPFLPTKTVDNVSFCGSSKEEMASTLDKYIERSQLREEYASSVDVVLEDINSNEEEPHS